VGVQIVESGRTRRVGAWPVLLGSIIVALGCREATVARGFLEALTDPGTRLEPVLLTVPDAVPSGLSPVFRVRSPGVSR